MWLLIYILIFPSLFVPLWDDWFWLRSDSSGWTWAPHSTAAASLWASQRESSGFHQERSSARLQLITDLSDQVAGLQSQQYSFGCLSEHTCHSVSAMHLLYPAKLPICNSVLLHPLWWFTYMYRAYILRLKPFEGGPEKRYWMEPISVGNRDRDIQYIEHAISCGTISKVLYLITKGICYKVI